MVKIENKLSCPECKGRLCFKTLYTREVKNKKYFLKFAKYCLECGYLYICKMNESEKGQIPYPRKR